MENTTRHSLNTQLVDRLLWFDGDSVMSSDQISNMMLKGADIPTGLCVDTITPELKQFNRLIPRANRILEKDSCRTPFDLSWNLPQEWLELDVYDHLAKQLKDQRVTGDDLMQKIDRINDEMDLYEHHDLINFLRTLVYIVNTLLNSDVPWGVGRGSGVSSYVLYLIGVHDVDSVEYELDIHDFLSPIS